MDLVGNAAINTKQSCHQQFVPFTKDPGKSGSFTPVPGGRKTRIFHLQTKSIYTSQDNVLRSIAGIS